MIFRLSTKLAAKLKVTPSQALPLDPNPFADWSANLFTAGRTQFVIVTNTASLYSAVLPGRGIASDRQFVESVLGSLRLFLEVDGLELIFHRFMAPASNEILFSKAWNRSVTGSMNDLVFQAKFWLTEGELSHNEIATRLNDTPLSMLEYRNPRKAFQEMVAEN